MFTGIVQGVFPVRRVVRKTNALSYAVELPESLRSGLQRGASVSVDGVCQTVAALEGPLVHFDANDETLRVTTLGGISEGAGVHVERSARAGDENGGHALSGHVDGTAEIAGVERSPENLALVVRVPAELAKYVFNKGFVALQGASLTVNGWDEEARTFRVNLIPETLRLTTFGSKREGDRVNLEVDRQTQVVVDTIDRALGRALRERGAPGGAPSRAAPADNTHVMPTAPKPEPVMLRGKGSWIYDVDGREYLDFVQGWAVNALGHAPPDIAKALHEQADRLWHASPAFYNANHSALASKLAALAGMDHVFVCATGAEANESAIKIARKWGSVHRNGAYEIVTTDGAFHGRTLATMSASGKPAFAKLFEPKVPGFPKVPFGDLAAVERAVGPGTVAIMLEPIQGEAGVVVPPPGYLRALRAIADKAGILLMFDEVQTGVGRTGTFFAFEQEGVRPDVVTLGKGLGAGIPVAAMICPKAVNCFQPGDQGGTHVGNALLCAVASAVVDTISAPAFLAGVRARSEHLVARLRGIADEMGGTVRGRGMLQAIVFPRPVAEAAVVEARARGLLLNAPRPDILRFMPALNVTDAEVDRMADVLLAVLRGSRPA